MNIPCRVSIDENKHYLEAEFEEDEDLSCEDLALLDEEEE